MVYSAVEKPTLPGSHSFSNKLLELPYPRALVPRFLQRTSSGWAIRPKTADAAATAGELK